MHTGWSEGYPSRIKTTTLAGRGRRKCHWWTHNSCWGSWCLLVNILAASLPPNVWGGRAQLDVEENPTYWYRWGEREVLEAVSRPVNDRVARNIVLFVGDGMGLSTVTASRIFKGQQRGRSGEEEILAFEEFPNIALAKTYNIDHQVADSAATATAFLCGVKARYGTVGVDGRARRGDCSASLGKNVTCVLELAQRAGKSTGLVTTGRVTHATPAPLYAHSADRAWEDDRALPDNARADGCLDIGAQLVGRVGSRINVVLGGGRQNLMPDTSADPEHAGVRGHRRDGRHVIHEWLHRKRRRGQRAAYVWNKKQFDDVDPHATDDLIGLFDPSHLQFDKDRDLDKAGEPSLSEMVEKAVRILDKNPEGFFLLVEGARIDHAHHGNIARRALEETVAMEMAVKRAVSLLGTDDTLVIVTADHSHPLNIGSHAKRGNPILGLTDYSNDETMDGLSNFDRLPYTTLSYANGPGYDGSTPRVNLTNTDTSSRNYRQTTAVPLSVVTHDGTDVPIYAAGPMAHLFHSTHEQHYVFHVMTYAACLTDASHAHCAAASEPVERAFVACQQSCPTNEGSVPVGVLGDISALSSVVILKVLLGGIYASIF